MKFMLSFDIDPDFRDQAIARFRAGGGLPPAGATLLGRWTRLDFSGGFDLLETDDPACLLGFALEWSDLMHIEIVPVADDALLGAVLAAREAPKGKGKRGK